MIHVTITPISVVVTPATAIHWSFVISLGGICKFFAVEQQQLGLVWIYMRHGDATTAADAFVAAGAAAHACRSGDGGGRFGKSDDSGERSDDYRTKGRTSRFVRLDGAWTVGRVRHCRAAGPDRIPEAPDGNRTIRGKNRTIIGRFKHGVP